MKKISDLGKAAKTEALQKGDGGAYDDLTNEALGKMVKRSNPGAYDDYFDEDTFQKVAQLQEVYHPSRGHFSSWWQRGKSEGRAKLKDSLNNEQRLALEGWSMMVDAVLAGRKKQVDFEMFLAQHQAALFQLKATMVLIEEALRQGYTLENWQQCKLDQEKLKNKKENREHKSQWKMIRDNNKTDNQIRLQDNEYGWKLRILQEMGTETDNQIRLAEALSEIKISETQQLEAIKVNNELAMLKEQLKAAIIGKGIPHYETKMLAQEIKDRCYEEIEEIEYSDWSENTKHRMIADREKLLDFFDDEGKDLIDE